MVMFSYCVSFCATSEEKEVQTSSDIMRISNNKILYYSTRGDCGTNGGYMMDFT